MFLLLAVISFKVDAAATKDVCTTRTPFEAAVTTADGNTYFFREKQFWKLKKMGEMVDPPRSIQDGWEEPGPIDAAFTFKLKQNPKPKTYIFKDKEVWTYNNMNREAGPNSISDTWEDTPAKMGSAKFDAAFAQEDRVYFLKGIFYYEWKEGSPHLEKKKIIQLVKGAKDLKGDLTAAFSKDGDFYLIKGSKYWKAKRVGGTVVKEGDVFVDFFGCPKDPKALGLGACVGERCNLGSAATSSLAPLATTDQSWKNMLIFSHCYGLHFYRLQNLGKTPKNTRPLARQKLCFWSSLSILAVTWEGSKLSLCRAECRFSAKIINSCSQSLCLPQKNTHFVNVSDNHSPTQPPVSIG